MMVKTGARVERLTALLRKHGFSVATKKPSAPRISDLRDGDAARIRDFYRELGGTLENPALRPGSWDLAFTNGLVVELDEELHFNRYRHITLDARLPWSAEYAAYSADFENECLRAGRWGLRWTSPSTERMFGPPDPPGTFGTHGAPRWKQRALYDAMKDAAPHRGLVRLSTHDRLGATSLAAILSGGAEYDPALLAELLEKRVSSPLD
jgi:hypothetical protein